MKKFILFFVILASTNVFSQKDLFNDAIKRGLMTNGTYLIDNKKNKPVSYSNMMNYITQKGYYIIKGYSKNIKAFGNSIEGVDNIMFVSQENFPLYIISTYGNIDVSNIQLKKGSAFIPLDKNNSNKFDKEVSKKYKYYGSIRINAKTMSGYNEYFYCKLDDIFWSGDVKNGLICDKGVGVIRNGSEYSIIYGDFNYGIPYYDFGLEIIQWDDYANSKTKFSVKPTVKLRDLDRYSFSPELSEAFKLFKQDLCEIETPVLLKLYERAKSVSKDNYEKITPHEDYVNFYIKLFSSSDYLPLAKELKNVYTVINALTLKLSNSYHYVSFGLGVFWGFENHDVILNEAANIIKVGKTDSKYGFNQFYSQVEKEVNNKLAAFNRQVERERNGINDEIRKNERELTEYKEEMCEQCKLDAKKSTFPEGYVPASSLFFGLVSSVAHSKNDGKIVLKTGHSVNWRYIYENPTYIETEGIFGYNRYDTYQEMIKDIIKKCKEDYCN